MRELSGVLIDLAIRYRDTEIQTLNIVKFIHDKASVACGRVGCACEAHHFDICLAMGFPYGQPILPLLCTNSCLSSQWASAVRSSAPETCNSPSNDRSSSRIRKIAPATDKAQTQRTTITVPFGGAVRPTFSVVVRASLRSSAAFLFAARGSRFCQKGLRQGMLSDRSRSAAGQNRSTTAATELRSEARASFVSGP